jgi:hypothetical protein
MKVLWITGEKVMRIITITFLLAAFCFSVFGQNETLTNKEVILMTRAGLSEDLIIRKVNESNGDFDTTAQALIELKKAGVSDVVIALMMEKKSAPDAKIKPYSDSTDDYSFDSANLRGSGSTSRIVLDPKEAMRSAKTIAIKKSSLQPSRQALEKELLKRKEWKDLNLTLVRYKEDADLLIEIGYVSMSWITHRYTYRIYDNKSGTVIAAGETTSWGSLAENLARGIAKRLEKALKN